ncbi:uncharacterized protein LOC117117345 [Anneissia japonica]|uniref:uncharacterized protein LOC117117345 n=1 Tax=Anneissia japonica TaxID=1529436 RepID=UPI001425B8AC|nr:uncharacterized protein LOC117117345 [Anneissia japonica]
MGCATITVNDGAFSNSVRITNTGCATNQMVNSIVCESAGICPVPKNEVKQTRPTPSTSTTPVHQTTSIWPTVVNQSIFTNEKSAEYTTPIINRSNENQSKKESGLNSLMVAASIAGTGTTIVIILLIFLLGRRRQKKKEPRYLLGPNQHLPSTNLSIKNGQHDGGTVSYSDGVVVCENHQGQGESYSMLDATNMHSPSRTLVVNDVYATPYSDAVANYGMQDQGHDIPNAADMDSSAENENGLGGDVYAVPDKKSKGRKEQEVDEAYDTPDASDMQPASEQHGKSVDVLNDTLYVNATNSALEEAAYDSINANDKHSGKQKLDGAYDVPSNRDPSRPTGDRQQVHDSTYNVLNGAKLHSKPGKYKSDNEYGRLNTAHHMPPKDDVYSYVETSIGCRGIVSPGEDNAYDKLQRNTELGDALTNDNYYNSLQ